MAGRIKVAAYAPEEERFLCGALSFDRERRPQRVAAEARGGIAQCPVRLAHAQKGRHDDIGKIRGKTAGDEGYCRAAGHVRLQVPGVEFHRSCGREHAVIGGWNATKDFYSLRRRANAAEVVGEEVTRGREKTRAHHGTVRCRGRTAHSEASGLNRQVDVTDAVAIEVDTEAPGGDLASCKPGVEGGIGATDHVGREGIGDAVAESAGVAAVGSS